jgi:hypothetical protein
MQDKDSPPFRAGWIAGRAPDEESLDSELQRVGEASDAAFSCLLLDAAVTLELVQATSRGSEMAISILGVLGPYIASIEGMRSRREGDRCLCCDGAVFFRRHKPTIIAVLLPLDVEDPGTAVVMGICERWRAQRGLAAGGLEGRCRGKNNAGATEGLAWLPTCYSDPWAQGEGIDVGHWPSRHSLPPPPQTSSAHPFASALPTIPVSNR